MKQTITIALLALCLALTAVAWGADVGPGPQPGDLVADVPLEPSDREAALLDLPGGTDPIHLSDLPGRFLLVQSYSMYCPHCQASAPSVNTVYETLAASPHAQAMTMVGLAAGNSRFEVDFYQEQYQVPFALFPDLDMTFYGCLHKPGTPVFVVLEKTEAGLVVRFVHQGPFGDPDEFLHQIFQAVGLEP